MWRCCGPESEAVNSITCSQRNTLPMGVPPLSILWAIETDYVIKQCPLVLCFSRGEQILIQIKTHQAYTNTSNVYSEQLFIMNCSEFNEQLFQSLMLNNAY